MFTWPNADLTLRSQKVTRDLQGGCQSSVEFAHGYVQVNADRELALSHK